jgi:hypothetical protein
VVNAPVMGPLKLTASEQKSLGPDAPDPPPPPVALLAFRPNLPAGSLWPSKSAEDQASGDDGAPVASTYRHGFPI